MTDVTDTTGLAGIVDVVVVLTVVAVAIAWLVSRFVHKKTGSSSSGTVVVGASLQRGLDRAARNKSRRR
jgi:hypothetical protein